MKDINSKQIIEDIANMGEHDSYNAKSLDNLVAYLQNTIRKNIQEKLELQLVKELVMGSEETVAPQEMYPEEVYERALEKIARGTCDCPSIEFGAKHSASCPIMLAREALNFNHVE